MSEVQIIILNIYKEFKRICDEKGIYYFAIGGTAIGAVRHNGFIPWDDDMDVAIPIEQYDEALSILRKELPNYYIIITAKESPYNLFSYAKIVDTRTTFTEDFLVENNVYTGVWIDIMPMSGMPCDENAKRKFCNLEHCLEKFHNYTYSQIFHHKSLISKAIWLCCRIFKVFGGNFFWRIWERVIQKYPFMTSVIVGPTFEEKMSWLNFPGEWFQNRVLHSFEDSSVYLPIRYHDYLTKYVGDYMKFPPLKKRTSDHMFSKGVIDLNTPFKKYAKE